ncbi:DUF835 domain-containing protein [Thermococcus paralvinellae]|uniref:DUF835 domain-containing protein n=1 Tax=Thermococcus paralvinellae TaxID=582419 RepID=W0I6E8_9EURY|nr:DUF835 domain-containing protein [Thermococcus paralvinellae]AHF79958.1 Hypothetical protein TES1_0568 [Thermococcus paralvinellae]
MRIIAISLVLVVGIIANIIVALSFKYRSVFIQHHPRLKKFYDYILLGIVFSVVAKLVFIPLDLDDMGLISIPTSQGVILNMAGNFLFMVGGVLFILGWMHILKTLTSKYDLIPIVEFEGSDDNYEEIPAGIYLCKVDKCYHAFLKLLKGRAGVIISRIPPDTLCKKFKLEKTPILWLTKVEGDKNIHPHRLEFLMHTLVDFMRRCKNPKVVMLDGIEYLILENGFTPVFKFLTALKDYAVMNNTIIVVPIKEEIFDTRELSILKREFGELKL